MTPSSWPTTLALSALAALVAFGVLLLAVAGTIDSFGPGELDLVLTARSMASGVYPPLWAGAVHPDALGTWIGAFGMSFLLRLGIPDVFALKCLAAAHYVLLAGVSVGLASRIAGWRAGLAGGAALIIGAPAIAAAHTRYLATTVEIASVELALVWMLVEWHRRPARGWLLALGLGLGTAVIYSLHAAWLALLTLAVVGWTSRRRELGWRPALLLIATGVVAAVGWLGWPDPLGPPGHAFTIKTLGPLQLLTLIDPSDLATLARRAPFALLTGEEGHQAAQYRPLHVPLAATLALALFGGVVATARRQVDAPVGLVALFALGIAAPLVLGGDLLGYPAAYRYYVPVVPPACVLLGVAVARSPWPRAAGLVLALLVSPGLLSLGHVGNREMARPEAAFFAGQHRLVFPRDALHTHFLMLTPWVQDDELIGWVQGYGLHVGREYARQAPTAKIEFDDSFVGIDGGVPPIVNRHWHKQRAERWLEGADWLGPGARSAFLVGVGLGIAEDGHLEELDLRLLESAVDHASVARGIGAALGERVFHIGDDRPLRLDGAYTWTPAERQAMAEGYAETSGKRLFPEARPTNLRVLAHPHPFTYADLGVVGRGGQPSGPR